MLSRLAATALTLALLAEPAFCQTSNLQGAVDRAMRGRAGSAIVLDVASNRILAQHNLAGAARRLVRPGSAVKPFTLLALLSQHVVDPTAPFVCPRKLQVAGHRLDCGHPTPPAGMDAISALAYSCNGYFATMAARLRPAQFQQALLQAGISGPSGLAAREAKGYVGLSTTEEQLQLQGIGEDSLRVTPLAMLRAYRELALLRRNGVVDDAHRTVFAGMDAATEYGMARLAQPAGMKVAGKTGTALADEGRWTHGWFLGFAPAGHPEIALVIFLEHGAGPADAAPVAREIFSAARERP